MSEVGVAGKANNKKLNDKVLFNLDLKFNHTTMENTVVLPLILMQIFPACG